MGSTLFNSYDLDSDGFLNYSEFVVGSIGVKLTDMFKALDADGSGTLDRAEVIELVNGVSRDQVPEEVVTKVI